MGCLAPRRGFLPHPRQATPGTAGHVGRISSHRPLPTIFKYRKWSYAGGMQTVKLDSKGRALIPKDLREELGLTEEDQLAVAVERGEIRLKPIVRKQYKVKAGRKWGKEAFLRVGEASFADEE